MKKKILKNTFFCGLSTIIISIIGFFLLPFMVFHLGIEKYGLIAIFSILSISGYISLFELGLQGAITRFIAQYKAQGDPQSIVNVFKFFLGLFFLIGILLVIIGFTLKIFFIHLFHVPMADIQVFSKVLTLVFYSYSFIFPSIVYIGLFVGLQKYGFLKITEIITFIIYALCVVVALNSGKGFEYVVYANLLCLLLRFICYVVGSFFVLPKIANNIMNFDKIKEVLKMAKYLFTIKIAGFIYHNLPRFSVAICLGPIFLASYEIAVKIPRVLKTVSGVINSVIMPVASELSTRKDVDRLKKLFVRGVKYQIFFLMPVVFTGILFAKEILHLWMSEKYIGLAPLLQIMFVWNLLVAIVTYNNSIMNGMNKKMDKMALWAWLTTGVSTVITFGFINHFKLYAVVVGYCAGILVWIPFIAVYTCKEIGVSKIQIFGLFYRGCKYMLFGGVVLVLLKSLFFSFQAPLTLVSMGLSFLLFFVLMYECYLDKKERVELISLIKRYPIKDKVKR